MPWGEEVLAHLDFRSAARVAGTCRFFRRAAANAHVRRRAAVGGCISSYSIQTRVESAYGSSA